MMAQLFIFKKHIPELTKYIKFGRDLYRNGVLVVFCDTWKVPKEYHKYVVDHKILDLPQNCNC